MGIDNFEVYSEKLNNILENLDQFCASINREDDSDVDEIIQKIKKIKTSKEDEEKPTKEKTIGFLYSSAIRFYRQAK